MINRQPFYLTMLTLLITLSGVWIAAQQDSGGLDLNRIRRATVFVIQASDNDLDTRCIGSGTIVRFDGLILTNAHNVMQSEACPGEELIIAMSIDPEQPPVPKYRASIAQVDSGLDLALLRIDRELDGRQIDPDNLPILPFVEVGNSDEVILDETLTIVGYPDAGNSSTEANRVSVAAFMAEPGAGDRSWFKLTSDSGISGLMSGGGAYNQAGQLMGVPTSAPITANIGGTCLQLEDTNSDGFVNNNDACVPISDFVSVIRPVNFARSLIRSASLQLSITNETTPVIRRDSDLQPTVERLYFATSVSNDLSTQVIASAPSGTTSLYLFFDYFNFTEDTVYEVRVSVDGVPGQIFSLPPVRWSGGTNGLWYIGSSGQPWSNGLYEFRILVNGLVADTATIRVGGVPEEQPSFSNIVFGLKDEQNILQGENYVLPTGDVASARFIYRNMEPGTEWIWLFYYNGVPLAGTGTQNTWTSDDGVNGARDDVSIRPVEGLRPGNYRVDLYIGSPPRLSVTGDFVVAGTAEGVLPNVFSNIQFARDDDGDGIADSAPTNSFPDGAEAILAQFDWQRIAAGTLWTMQWMVDGEVFYEETVAWRDEESGQAYQMSLTAPENLPDGTYTLNLIINGVLLETSQVSVGIGQLEINRLEEIGGTQLGGQVVDADSGEGIAGATFILISEDYSVADFVWDSEQIYALAVADTNGRFEIDRSLELESPYSVYVIAEGYLPITQDGFLINEENLAEAGGSPIDMYIPMTKD